MRDHPEQLDLAGRPCGPIGTGQPRLIEEPAAPAPRPEPTPAELATLPLMPEPAPTLADIVADLIAHAKALASQCPAALGTPQRDAADAMRAAIQRAERATQPQEQQPAAPTLADIVADILRHFDAGTDCTDVLDMIDTDLRAALAQYRAATAQPQEPTK